MDILIELITKNGKRIYESVCNIRNIVIFDDRTNKAKLQINEDLSISKPVKPREVKNADE